MMGIIAGDESKSVAEYTSRLSRLRFYHECATAIAFVTLAAAAPAFAQTSLNSSFAPATDYALPPPHEPSLIEPSPRDDAALDEKKPSAATPEDANLGDDATPSDATSSVVDEVDAETDSENQVNNVLEIPQALPSGNLQASFDADPSVRDGGDQSPDQLCNTDDGRAVQDDNNSGVSVVSVPLVTDEFNLYGAGVFQSTQTFANPGFRPGFAPTSPGVMALRRFAGWGDSTIFPTSPMFPHRRARFSNRMRGRAR
jgi:hypothetical protein